MSSPARGSFGGWRLMLPGLVLFACGLILASGAGSAGATAAGPPAQAPADTSTPTIAPTPCLNTWSLLAPYPIFAAYQAAASYNGQVYVFGGDVGTAVPAAYRYNPSTDSWYPLAPLPQGRAGARAVSDGTYIYILGGNDPGPTPTNTLWRYDPQSNSYQTLASFSQATAFHAAVYLAGKIYRIAGNGTSTMEVYDIAANTWSVAASYPLSIAGLMAVSDGSYIYAAGGTNHSVKTYRYDPLSDSWDDAAVPDLPDPHEAGAAGFVGGRMLVAGGFGSVGTTNEVLSWTPGENSWVSMAPLPNADGGMGSAASGDSIYAVGGIVATQYRNWNQRYYEFGCGTPTATATGTPPTATPTYTRTPTITGTPPTATATASATPTPDCSSVDVHPTYIVPPGAFIYVTVPPGWTWTWDPITPLFRYNCYPNYPIGVGCGWSCSNVEPRIGYAEIHIYDQSGVERCLVGITGSQPFCASTATPTGTATGTPTDTPTPLQTPTAVPTPCPLQFTDVPTGSTFYPYIHCLVCRGIVSGYSDGTFRPGNNVTRGQIAKVVSNAASFQDDVTGRWTYTDVPDTNTFWAWVERLTLHGVMSGYDCGGPGEPCDPQGRPYFRPGNDATRGQLAKIVSNAAGFTEEHTEQVFADVPLTHTFYQYIARLASRQIIGGYPCGGPGEPCDEYNRPYFRPGAAVTRGQAAKITANAFFPSCETPGRR